MTTYICETMEENANLRIRVSELLQRCDLLNYELEHANDGRTAALEKIDQLEAQLCAQERHLAVLVDRLGE